ncbi:MAG TPA: hypothetical protein VFO73_04805 [Candidatus Limnocylindrales bacterium]|nr:hypothetical protein [Candidatus Limnocylindrales bacterium]
MRRALSLLASGLLAFTVLISGSIAPMATVSAATIAPTTTCANGVDNTPGLGVICEVTVVNTITPTGGSATVTVRECHGAAGDPEAACTTTTDTLTAPVTAVTQCNDATNGGGGTLRCSVDVTNNYVVDPAPTAVTVNQCVGSGDGITIGCDPFPATTTGATITQCNGSANGGTLVELTCTATGTESDGLAVTINQCNDSTNGGGALVICSANIENNLVAPDATPRITQPPTDTIAADQGTSGGGSAWAVVFVMGLFGAGLAVMTLPMRRRVAR